MNVFIKLFNQMRLALKLIADPRVPLMVKIVPVLALGYLISPIDLIPDALPFLGQVDDLGVLLLGLEAFIKLSPPLVVDELRAQVENGSVHAKAAPDEKVVDAEWSEVKH